MLVMPLSGLAAPSGLEGPETTMRRDRAQPIAARVAPCVRAPL
jgi:hypothetical protein